jgi:23S rRNA pseudouridine1911/1915/1917 synthase
MTETADDETDDDASRWSLVLRGAGGRADVEVLEALRDAGVVVTRSALHRSFDAGLVTEGGVALRPAATIATSRTVDVVLVAAPPLRAMPEAIPLTILFEDDALLVIDKPAGMAMHAGPGHDRGTLVNAVLGHLGVGPDALPVLAGNDATRPGIVHRLDRDTSGVVVVAKHAAAQEHLAAQFRTHDLGRAYLGLVDGVPRWSRLEVDTLHGRDPADRRRFSPDTGTRRARTDATVERALHGAAIVRFELHTGRTHQIRMHARKLGHPILGDALYGHAPGDPHVRAAIAGLGRHALHAALLRLRHPDGRTMAWTSALPPELAAVVERLSTAPH